MTSTFKSEKPTIIIVGGSENKKSKIVQYIAEELEVFEMMNGDITTNNLHTACYTINQDEHNLIIWMPDIDNTVDKIYPEKPIGSILICSKVMRSDNYIEAVKRIFMMNANAVISISKDTKPYTFNFIDALGNSWGITQSIEELCYIIKDFYYFTKSAKRSSLVKSENHNTNFFSYNDLIKLIDINKKISKDVEEKFTERYFGNLSTRCFKLFPSKRVDLGFLFSARNTDKRFLDVDDMIFVKDNKYFSDRKPSVDTPVQLELYRKYPKINHMIHGHAYIKDAQFSKRYCLCGDLSEAYHLDLNDNGGVINLINHGFLIYGTSLEQIEYISNNIKFEQRNIGYERIIR